MDLLGPERAGEGRTVAGVPRAVQREHARADHLGRGEPRVVDRERPGVTENLDGQVIPGDQPGAEDRHPAGRGRGAEPGQHRMRIGLQVGQRDPLGLRVRVGRCVLRAHVNLLGRGVRGARAGRDAPAGEHGHQDPPADEDQPEVDQAVGQHGGERRRPVQPGGGQRRGQGQLDQRESPRRNSRAADRGPGPVDQQQAAPGNGLARGLDRAGQRPAVRRPVQHGQPEHPRVPWPGQPQARHAVQELIQAVDTMRGHAEDAPGQADQPGDDLVQELADVFEAQREQHRGTRHDEHEGAEEARRAGQRRRARHRPDRQQQGERGGGEDRRDGQRPARGGSVHAVPAELAVGEDQGQFGARERHRDRYRVRGVGDRHHRAETGRPAADPQELLPAEPEARQRDHLRRQGEQEPGPVQVGQHVQRLGQRVALDDDDADQDRDGQDDEHAAPHPVPARSAGRCQVLI